MTVAATHRSIVLASQYRVRDAARMWTAMKDYAGHLSRLGAHHVVGYQSTANPHEVLVTIGIRTDRPVEKVLSSDAVLRWFDVAGVVDIPPIFVGTVVDKISISLSDKSSRQMPPAVIVAATTSVEDVTALVSEIRAATDRFVASGIRKVWVYEAVDQPNEVLVLQEIDDLARARQWIKLPDTAAMWMARAGLRAYPPLFVGTLMEVFVIARRHGEAG